MGKGKTPDKAYNAGDPSHVKNAKTAAKILLQQQEAANKAVVLTYDTRAFIWGLLTECGIHHAAVGDMTEAYRGEGKRDVGLWVMAGLFTSNPKAYTLMCEEANEREND